MKSLIEPLALPPQEKSYEHFSKIDMEMKCEEEEVWHTWVILQIFRSIVSIKESSETHLHFLIQQQQQQQQQSNGSKVHWKEISN